MLKKLLAFFEAVFVVFLVILIITIFTFFVSFSKEDSLPSVFGHSFFILGTDDMQNENGNGITKGSLVIASDAELDSLKEGMVVLCDVNDSENGEPDYDVLRIYSIEPGSETTKYTVSNEKMASNRTYIIDKDSIIAKCNYSSELLGQVIAFSRTTQGILTLVIIPCIVLIALQIVHMVARARKSKFEQVELETFEFPSDMTFPDDDQSPLYDPKKSDYSQKTDVEEFFNKDYKSQSKRKKKSSDDLRIDDETVSADKKSHRDDSDSKNTENADNNVKKKSKAIESESTGEKLDSNALHAKKHSALKETLNDKAIEDTVSVKTVESDVASANTAVELDNDKPLDNASENNIAIENIIDNAVQAPANDAESVESKIVESKVVESAEKSDENAVKKIKSENNVAVKVPAEKVNSANTDNAVQRPKKTTVKKRAVVKKGPSASAADLLKAIDTESKKLK